MRSCLEASKASAPPPGRLPPPCEPFFIRCGSWSHTATTLHGWPSRRADSYADTCVEPMKPMPITPIPRVSLIESSRDGSKPATVPVAAAAATILPAMSDSVQRAAAILTSARSLVVSSGAGMSAESGLSTFRDRDGLWSRFKPAELATPEAFQLDALKVWEWYRLRREVLAAVEPHDGHRVLARWEQHFAQMTVITQNVDGLHHRAGSRSVIELHGRLDVARCTACRY